MTNSKFLLTSLLLVGLLFTTTGATCMPRRAVTETKLPTVFQTPPDITQLAEAINRTKAIQQLQSNSVTIRAQDIPTLTANMVWERPRRFRLTGGVSRLTGTDFDLGSNEEVFWMATRHGPSPSLYFARHDQFATQIDRQVLPVSPDWLVEAMGIVEIDPYAIVQTPQQRTDGMWEIETTTQSQIGQYRRTLVVDPTHALVRQVILRDPSGRLLASSTLSDHQYYSMIQTALPQKVKVQLVPTGGPPLILDIDIGSYAINDTQGNDPNRWTIPNPAGYTVHDLVQLNNGMSNASQPPQYQPPTPTYPQAAYRGVTEWEDYR